MLHAPLCVCVWSCFQVQPGGPLQRRPVGRWQRDCGLAARPHPAAARTPSTRGDLQGSTLRAAVVVTRRFCSEIGEFDSLAMRECVTSRAPCLKKDVKGEGRIWDIGWLFEETLRSSQEAGILRPYHRLRAVGAEQHSATSKLEVTHSLRARRASSPICCSH